MHQDRGIQTDDIVSLLDYSLPPGLLDIPFKLYAQRAVIPATG
jgi:hypothetical protein